MDQHLFFERPKSLTLAEIAASTGANLVDASLGERRIEGLAVLSEAGPRHLTFFENQKYREQLELCHAGACFVSAKLENHLPSRIPALRVANPYRAFVAVARRMHLDALRPRSLVHGTEISERAVVDPSARLEDGVVVDPLAVIGPGAEVGQDTVIGAGAVIGPNVKIGRNCAIGAQTTVTCSLIGNNVIIHPGCRIGQDGFGYVPDASGLAKVPQTGRVIIQNDVEIGANTTVDRGALRDTVIGEGTKIDNLVQIAHNVVIGRNCIVVSQVGLSGSCTIGEGVALGARVGVGNHASVGDGAQLAAMTVVFRDIPPGGQWGGFPAKPSKLWLREVAVLERLAKTGGGLGEEKDAVRTKDKDQ